MHVLLITTANNEVRNTLQKMMNLKFAVIDCGLHTNLHGKDMKASFLSELETFFTKNDSPDILLTYRCPFIIPKSIYSRANIGAFNIHPSLLPKYSGMNPWDDVFQHRESETGVTIHRMTELIDEGPIILQSSFLIEESDTIETARLKSDQLAARLVMEFLYSPSPYIFCK